MHTNNLEFCRVPSTSSSLFFFPCRIGLTVDAKYPDQVKPLLIILKQREKTTRTMTLYRSATRVLPRTMKVSRWNYAAAGVVPGNIVSSNSADRQFNFMSTAASPTNVLETSQRRNMSTAAQGAESFIKSNIDTNKASPDISL